MRPLRLDLEGFTVFREPTVVDFTDADFFAFVGPTGSGKSTLLDAICFALYGTVPRWADQRGVAGVLAPSSAEARVRLAFETGAGRFVASRVITRDGKGRVKTSLAGLQRLPEGAPVPDTGDEADGVLGEVLAATPKEMDALVPQVVGLPYDHFVTCVVLPQGEFAQFLHAKPSERGDILVNLLGLHVYRRIAVRAGELSREAAAQAAATDRLLGSIEHVDDAAVAAAAERVERLRELCGRVERETPALARAQEAADAAERELAELDAAVTALGGVRVPADAAAVTRRVNEAAGALAEAERALAAAEDAEDAARAAAEDGPDVAALQRLLEAFDQLTETTAQRERAATEAGEAAAVVEQARRRQQVADEAVGTAELEYTEAQRNEVAGALRPHLVAGEPCPVCAQEVRTLPPPADATAVRAAEKKLAEARTAKAAADRQTRAAERTLATAEARLSGLDEQAGRLAGVLGGRTDRAEVVAELDAAGALRDAWRAASLRVRECRQAGQRARAAESGARDAARAAWATLDDARDRLAPFGPPPLDRSDLAAAWDRLVDWAGTAADARRRERAGREEAVCLARVATDEARDRLLALLGEHGLPAPGGADAATVSTTVAVALTHAENEHGRLRDRLRQLATHLADRDRYAAESRVAKSLADHLRANNFERWLLQEALDNLVEGASRIIGQLSSGQYALGHADGELFVVDHHDADLRRPVRTLSGGETFQASLAFALALSEQLVGMSDTRASLGSILLDEGFGTLDAATLDTVAATLENLAADGGRVVGIVTHVPALAERVPVRFELTKDAHGAHVERVG
ncbi:MAG TPA: SMC family ATPase [Streptosporangiales bacterium]